MTTRNATVILIFQDITVKDKDGADQPGLEISYQQFPIAEGGDPEQKRLVDKNSAAVKAARRVLDILSAHGKRVDLK